MSNHHIIYDEVLIDRVICSAPRKTNQCSPKLCKPSYHTRSTMLRSHLNQCRLKAPSSSLPAIILPLPAIIAPAARGRLLRQTLLEDSFSPVSVFGCDPFQPDLSKRGIEEGIDVMRARAQLQVNNVHWSAHVQKSLSRANIVQVYV